MFRLLYKMRIWLWHPNMPNDHSIFIKFSFRVRIRVEVGVRISLTPIPIITQIFT